MKKIYNPSISLGTGLQFTILLGIILLILYLIYSIPNTKSIMAQTPAFDFSLTNDGDKILSTGGRVTSTLTVTNAISGSTPRAVSLSSPSWTKATNAAPWVRRSGHTSLAFNNRVWVIGGADTDGVSLGDIWSSPDGTNWTQVTTAAPWGGNYFQLSSVVFNNRMWIFTWNRSNTSQEVWSSTDGATWSRVTASVPWNTDLAASRGITEMSVWGDRMWAVRIDGLWSSTDGVSWSRVIASVPWSSYDTLSPILNLNNRMWLIGGRFSRIPISTTITTWSSTDGVSWTQAGSTSWSGQQWISNSLVFNNQLWVMGAGAMWSSVDGITWTQTSAPWGGRDRYASLVFNNAIWIFGGFDGWVKFNDVWSTPSLSSTSCTPNPTCSITSTITSIPITTQTPVTITGSDGTNQRTTQFLLLPSTPSPPTVTTNSPTRLTSSNLTRTSTVTLSGSTTRTVSTTGWFRYSLTDPGSCNDTFGTRIPSTGGVPLGFDTTPATFGQTVSGLPTETIYYYCALASNIGGTAQGSIEAFQTPSVCSGNIVLTLAPQTTPSLGSVTPTASGLRACLQQINFREGSCLSGTEPLASTCTSDNTGCTGTPFTAPSSAGSYTYCAAIDKNEDGDTLDAGERSTATLTVTPSPTASASTCQQNNRATGLITAPNPITGIFGNSTQQCILDPKAAFVSFNIPSYDELKSIFYDQSKSVSKVSAPITATALPRPFTTDQIYHATGDININDSNRPIGTGVVVIFVDGNLNITTERINYPTTDPNGGLVFVVKGKVHISANTKQINAIIMAEGGIPSGDYYSICTSYDPAEVVPCPTAFTPNSQQLIINGSLISLHPDYPIRFRRQLTANSLNPAEKIIYQPKYLVLLKDLFSETLKVWKEIY